MELTFRSTLRIWEPGGQKNGIALVKPLMGARRPAAEKWNRVGKTFNGRPAARKHGPTKNYGDLYRVRVALD